MSLRRTVALASVACCLGAVPVSAQVARSGGGDQRAVQQLQALAQERTALQSENGKLKKDLETAQADAKAARAERDALKAKLVRAEAQGSQPAACAQSEQTIQQQRQRLDELVARFREMALNLKTVETERTRAQEQATAKSRSFDACASANVELAGIAKEVLARYERAGTAHTDPVLRLTRTRIENLVDEYRQRVDELKLPPTAPADSTPRGR